MRLTSVRRSSGESVPPGVSSSPAAFCDLDRRAFDADQRAVVIEGDQPAADRERRGRDDLAVLAQRELGRPAADVDVEEHLVLGPRQLDRARAVGGHDGFEIVPGGCADELSGLLGEQIGDRARVDPLHGLAGQDHRAAVDIGRCQAGLAKGLGEKRLQGPGIDRVVRPVRREQDRRAPQDLAVDHHEPARQRLGQPLQVDAGEHQMRGRRADVDADGGQLDIVGPPDGVPDELGLTLGRRVEMRIVELVHRLFGGLVLRLVDQMAHA